MNESEQFMRIHLGLKHTPQLTINEITARAREMLGVVCLGRQELAHLAEPGVIGRSGTETVDGFVVLQVPLHPPIQPTMTPHAGRGRKRDLRGTLGREDDEAAVLVQQTLEFVERNAELVTRTAHVMNTAPDAGATLKRIEKEEGVNLTAARHFHRKNRGKCGVEVGGHEITFQSLPVRTGVAGPDPIEKRLMLAKSKNTHTDLRVVPEDAPPDIFGYGFNGIRQAEFRIGPLASWGRVVLDGARHLSLPVTVSYRPVTSTLSLRKRRAEIQKVLNWDELLDAVVSHLVEVQAARRNRKAP